MRDVPREDLLTIVGCEIEKRPEVPAIADLAPLARRIERTGATLVAEFPGGARELVEAFAAAERQCCAGIGWEVEAGRVVTLRITASGPALEAIEQMLNEDIEQTQ